MKTEDRKQQAGGRSQRLEARGRTRDAGCGMTGYIPYLASRISHLRSCLLLLASCVLLLSVWLIAPAQQKPEGQQRERPTPSVRRLPPAPPPSPQSSAGERAREAARIPWLVTVIHRTNVKDLVAQLRNRGVQVAALDGLMASQQITNITSGIVMDAHGRILTRLLNPTPDLKAQDITIMIADGRSLQPHAVHCDEASGYTVIEIPGLNIAPPPSASWVQIQKGSGKVNVVYRIPEMKQLREALLAAERAKLERRAKARLEEAVRLSFVPLQIKENPARLTQATFEEVRADQRPALLVETQTEDWLADGSVVVNEKNEVLGIAEELSPSRYVVNPIATLRSVVEQVTREMRKAPSEAGKLLSQTDKRFGGWLGIRAENVAELAASERAKLAAAPEAAVIITEVIAEGPAARAGLHVGDALLSYNGQRIASVEELARFISTTPVGEQAALEIWRAGARQRLNVRIDERPSSRAETPPEREKPLTAQKPLSLTPDEKKKITAELDESPKLSPSQLGIKLVDLTEQLADFFGVSDERGVLITEVSARSPAAHAGLRAGDVITKLNGASTSNRREFIRVLRDVDARGPVEIAFALVRERKPLSLVVRISP